jgi:hypothetical protein
VTKAPSDRRLLLKCEGKSYKLLSLTQRNDGSIYIGFPYFRNIKWMGIDKGPEAPTVSMVDSTVEEGKLSFHASGVAGFRSHEVPGDHKLRVRGNYLYNHHNSTAGVRHLVSVFMEQPIELPPVFPERNSDFWIHNAKPLKPFVLILFAIPRAANVQSVDFQPSFHIDEIETVPPDMGAGLFDLKFHSILWFIYRTKFMNRWPRQSYVSYYDGFTVPMYIGKSENETSGELRFELNVPTYEMVDSELRILLASGPDS